MNNCKEALKAAIPFTIPVMMGYMFLGIAFGVLLEGAGYGVEWSLLMSVITYSGAIQFLTIGFLTGNTSIINIIFISLMVNVRHFFYGLSMLKKFEGMGKKKLYMIFSLSDETFSILCSSEAPEGIDSKLFMFFIALLNQLYWVTGSVIGSTVGGIITFNSEGIDFAMTALFVIIFVDQWKLSKSHFCALVGVLASVICLIVFGSVNFVLPSMLSILGVLILFQRYIENKEGE